jgi:malate dehydrogenase (oxaloacetate-decarboxylating)(NADP+)
MQADGHTEREARGRCWLVDSQGLGVAERTELAEHKKPSAHPHSPVRDFIGAVKALKPTAIIGVGATPNTFTREVIETMTQLNERPIVFALSNPTSRAECTAEQAYQWSGGKALFASGSPFDPVEYQGRRYVPRQGNNSYIFPGVGLGAIAVGTSRVNDAMFMAAARALAETVTTSDLEQGSLYPPLLQIRSASLDVATAVAEVAFAQGLAGIERPADLAVHIRDQMYVPEYVRYAA